MGAISIDGIWCYVEDDKGGLRKRNHIEALGISAYLPNVDLIEEMRALLSEDKRATKWQLLVLVGCISHTMTFAALAKFQVCIMLSYIFCNMICLS